MTADDIELTIDEEFSKLVPRHSTEEAEEFRKSVEIPGRFKYPILYWRHQNQNIVVDGRHRFELWCALPENTPIPPPRVEEVLFPDREAVRKEIIRDRLGRASLDSQTRKLLIGKLYNEEKASVGRPAAETPSTKDDSGKLRQNGAINSDSTAAAKVGTETKTPPRTVQRYGAYAEALDVIGNVNGKAKADIESGKLKLPQKDVLAIAKLDRPLIGTAMGNVRNGRKWNDGIASTNGKPGKPRTKKPESPLKPLKKSSGDLSRALAKVAEKHGQGAHYKAIYAALTTINKAIEDWEESL